MRTEYIYLDNLQDEPLETRIVEKLIEIFLSNHLDSHRLNEQLMTMVSHYRSRLVYLNKLYNQEKKYEQQQLEVE